MVQRFVYTTGTISVANGASVVIGSGTAWGGRDREGAQIWYLPAASPGGPPQRIGVVAAAEPRGVYDHGELPLVSPWQGAALVGVAYELIDGAAIANGVTQASIYARFAAFLESSMGLVGNTADAIDWPLVPENALFVDAVSRVIYQWRGGLLNPVHAIGLPFTPRGAWDDEATYEINDLISFGGFIFVSNANGNLANEPTISPSPVSDANWTLMPLPGVPDVLAALGITAITISQSDPSGGADGQLWLKVS